MGGYNPGTRTGLIALIVSRRIKAEKARRALEAQADTPDEAKAAREAKKAEKRSGWFR